MAEKLPNDLIWRKCCFQILCFDQNEFLCILATAGNDDVPSTAWLVPSLSAISYPINLMTLGFKFHPFESLNDKEFRKFLEAFDAYLVMIHDGTVARYLNYTCTINFEPKGEVLFNF